MRLHLLVAAAVSALGLVACQPAETPVAENAEENVVLDEASALDTPIVLATEGLSAGTGKLIALGAPYDEAVTLVTGALGGATPVENTNNECPNGAMRYARWDAGLTLLFQNEALVGWESTGAGLTTGTGVHAGSTVQELRAAYPTVEIQETTTPSHVFLTEDGLYGPLNGAKTAVVSIRSGTNCDAS
ncbi:hypothetical protein [Brevundimonas sp. TWP2-3-2]|uniref:hypothetical protein n=1 Tax=unclassified Brevundimonas TaxID=2622653 RepID=UPI003CEA50E8